MIQKTERMVKLSNIFTAFQQLLDKNPPQQLKNTENSNIVPLKWNFKQSCAQICRANFDIINNILVAIRDDSKDWKQGRIVQHFHGFSSVAR